MTDRRFTLDEAEATLPDLRARLERIRAARHLILRESERVTSKAPVNGGGPESAEHRAALVTLRSELEAITAQGIVLRDAETGLVDFPSEREGQEVYLCWRLGEEHIGHWHPLDSGFGGRRPLG